MLTPVYKYMQKCRVTVSWESGGEYDEACVKAAKKAIRAALAYCQISEDTEVELLITDGESIRELNRDKRGTDSVTDVLSFPSLEADVSKLPRLPYGEDDWQDGRLFLGSVVICEERARAQAEEYGHTAEREFAFLAAHSALHLLGYDHVGSEADEKVMFELQEQILRFAGYPRPQHNTTEGQI